MFPSTLYMDIHKLYQTLTFLHLWGIRKTISRHSFFGFVSGIRARNVAAEIATSLRSVGHFSNCRSGDNSKRSTSLWGYKFSVLLYTCKIVVARHGERGKKRRKTEKEVGRQHQEMDRPGVRQVPKGSGEQGKMEEISFEIICSAQTTLAVKRGR